jgi:tetratricopeptide (TPR) repeat protein
MRSLFKKILDQPVQHVHLLEELEALYKDSGIEDIELERRLQEFVQSGRKAAEQHQKELDKAGDWHYPDGEPDETTAAADDGLMTLEGMDSFPDDSAMEVIAHTPPASHSSPPATPISAHVEMPAAVEPPELPPGEGKDHYDLGMVYKEMTLWDAAIAEFEQARHDRSVRVRATLALTECLQESRDLRGALDLLEAEAQSTDHSSVEHLSVMHQLGILHELLGNLEEAVRCFKLVRDNHPGYGDVEERISTIQSRIGGGESASQDLC